MNKDIEWALKQEAPPTCKHVLLVLAYRADKDHSSFPSLTRISLDTGLNRATVCRCIAHLLELGLIDRQNRGIDSTVYTLKVGAHRTYRVGAQRGSRTPHLVALSEGGSRTPHLPVGAQCGTEVGNKEGNKVEAPFGRLPDAQDSEKNDTETKLDSVSPSKGRKRDEAADIFAAKYEARFEVKYDWHPGDFPGIAKLRERLGLTGKETPAGWDQTCENYFETPCRKWTLQGLLSNYDVLRLSSIDRFGIPVNHSGANGNGHKTREQRNLEASRKVSALLGFEDSDGV